MEAVMGAEDAARCARAVEVGPWTITGMAAVLPS
eukprot:gene7787-7985_t